MKSMKEIAFEHALYHLDEYKRLKKELGEFDRLTCIELSKYRALVELIDESGYTGDWERFMKGIYIQRQAYAEAFADGLI